MAAPDRYQRLYDLLWPPAAPGALRVFAILDGARDPKVFGAVDASRQDKTCLYSVNTRWYLTDLKWDVIGVAPYVVELDHEDAYSKELLRRAWENNWGIFVRTTSGIDRLRRHLRSFLNVFTEGGKMLLFRYYDPRVMRVYLPTCTAEELHHFFGPVSAFVMPSREREKALRYSLPGRELRRDTVKLDGDTPLPALAPPSEAQYPRSSRPILRSAQMQAFRTARKQDFEDRMVEHLNKFFVRQCQPLGEANIRALIREGIVRAGKYGFRSEQEVCRFVDLMMVFGPRFDQDAPWAEAILTHPGSPNPLAQLLTAAQAHLRSVA